MKYFSTFSGIGGFELGINQAYGTLDTAYESQRDTNASQDSDVHKERSKHPLPTCVGYSEIDKYAISTYQSHFPEHTNYGDITAIDADKLPDFSLLVGGFPCQAFSVAGKRRGFLDETRGTLFFDLARILRAKRPRYFVFENVKGLLSHDSGRTFSTIIATLDDLGYDLQWQVLNSKDFGVPQNRERVFIVGHLRGEPRPEVFPLIRGNTEDNQPDKVQTAIRYPLKFANRNQRSIEGDYSYTVDSMNTGGVMIAKTIRVGGGKSPHGSKQNWDSYEIQGKIRRLTPTECERLQGFPDGWTLGSDTQRYRQCGNAVTTNVVQAVIEKLL